MASLRAHMLNWTLKAVFKSKPLHETDAKVLRAMAETMTPRKTPANITIERVKTETVKGEWHRYDKAEKGRAILYFHGGGYVFGSARAYRALTFSLARKARTNVFSVDYRMSPEYMFPAPVEDAVAAYKFLLDQGYAPSDISVGGDSAGGGLTLALFLSLKELGLPLPSCGFLFSPWTDLAATGESLARNEKSCAMFKQVYITEGAKRYLGGADPKTPLASPLYGDLSGLPPLQIYVSTHEVLLDDSLRLQEKLEAAGVTTELIVEKTLAHVWPIFPGRLPEADRDIARTADFILSLAQRREAA